MIEPALKAKDVERLASCSRSTAIELMERLGAVDLAAPEAKKRDLRLPRDVLEKFLRGGMPEAIKTSQKALRKADMKKPTAVDKNGNVLRIIPGREKKPQPFDQRKRVKG